MRVFILFLKAYISRSQNSRISYTNEGRHAFRYARQRSEAHTLVSRPWNRYPIIRAIERKSVRQTSGGLQMHRKIATATTVLVSVCALSSTGWAQTAAEPSPTYDAQLRETEPVATQRSSPREVAYQRFFFELGYSIGAGSAHPGMRAASLPSLLQPNDNPQTDGYPYNDSYIPSGTGPCDVAASEYCVRVNRTGLSLVHGVHLGLGWYVTPRFGLSTRLRIAPSAGGGPMSHVVVGLRGHFKLSKPRNEGFHAALFIGGMAGQIQVRPDQVPTPPAQSIDRPFARTGMGGAELGVKIGHRFTPNVGIFLSPEAYVLFPEKSFGFQATGGIDFAFGPAYAKRRAEEPIEETPAPVVRTPEEPVDEPIVDVTPEPAPRTSPIPGFHYDDAGRLRSDDPVRFELNSAKLTPESYEALDALAETVEAHDVIVLVDLEGHADERGPDRLNQRLSEQRAETIRTYLVRRKKLPSSRVRAEGFGATQPRIAHATTEPQHAENRRVEIYLIVDEGEDTASP